MLLTLPASLPFDYASNALLSRRLSDDRPHGKSLPTTTLKAKCLDRAERGGVQPPHFLCASQLGSGELGNFAKLGTQRLVTGNNLDAIPPGREDMRQQPVGASVCTCASGNLLTNIIQDY